MNPKEQSNQTTLEEDLAKFNDYSNKVFRELGGVIYIGEVEIPDPLRGILRDQAENFLTSQLFEILHSSSINEAYELALKQSGKSGDIREDVRFAKALYHWAHFMRNVVVKLAK